MPKTMQDKREIKFRAWNKREKRWVQLKDDTSIGFNLSQEENHLAIYILRLGFDYKSLVIMQYTGLKDKNGVEIYEGDIIDGLIVTYCADTDASLGMHAGWYLQRSNFESWTELMNSDDYEVVGNIYENPELILSNKDNAR